jgi:hypothetical protein
VGNLRTRSVVFDGALPKYRRFQGKSGALSLSIPPLRSYFTGGKKRKELSVTRLDIASAISDATTGNLPTGIERRFALITRLLSFIATPVGVDLGWFFRESRGAWTDRGRSEKRSRVARLQQRQHTIGCVVLTSYRLPAEAANCLCIPVPALQGLALLSHPDSTGSSCCVE